jgi:hypothetical protein
VNSGPPRRAPQGFWPPAGQGEPMPPAPRDAPREPPSGGVSNERGDPEAAIRRLPPPLASPACSSFPPARFAAEELGLGPGDADRHMSFLAWVGLIETTC